MSVLEVAMLPVRQGAAAAFEAAFAEARPLIEATEGFEGLELRREPLLVVEHDE